MSFNAWEWPHLMIETLCKIYNKIILLTPDHYECLISHWLITFIFRLLRVYCQVNEMFFSSLNRLSTLASCNKFKRHIIWMHITAWMIHAHHVICVISEQLTSTLYKPVNTDVVSHYCSYPSCDRNKSLIVIYHGESKAVRFIR